MSGVAESLPVDLAARLCKEVQDEQPIKLFTQCWGCVKFSGGDPAKMCGEIVSCNLVLKRHRKLREQGKL
jgi:hypothetical protein